MYQQMLVPLDGSSQAEQVLSYVRILAPGLKVPVRLLTSMTGEIYSGQEVAGRHRRAEEYLIRAGEPLQQAGVDVTTVVTMGDPAANIADEADRTEGTLVAMATHGQSGVQRWFLGSVTDRVLRSTRRPVLVVRSQESEEAIEPRLRTIVVTLDGSALAEEALPHGAALARTLGLPMVLARAAIREPGFHAGLESGAEAAEEREEMEGEALAYLREVSERVRQMGLDSVDVRVSHGATSMALLKLVREVPDHLVVMTSHGRSGIGRWALGSMTDRMVRHGEGPVLVVRSQDQGG